MGIGDISQYYECFLLRAGGKGSAATAVRINLFRKGMKNKAWLKNKKYVTYCFSCREFTEASGGWGFVPVTK